MFSFFAGNEPNGVCPTTTTNSFNIKGAEVRQPRGGEGGLVKPSHPYQLLPLMSSRVQESSSRGQVMVGFDSWGWIFFSGALLGSCDLVGRARRLVSVIGFGLGSDRQLIHMS